MSIILNIKRRFVNFYLLYLTLAILSIIIETFFLFQNLSVITDTFPFFLNPSVITDTFHFFLNLSVIADKLPPTSNTPSKTVKPPCPFRTGF